VGTDLSIITPMQALQKEFNAKEAFAEATLNFSKNHSEMLTLKNLKDRSLIQLAIKQEGKSYAEKERKAIDSAEWGLYLDGLNASIAESEKWGAQKEIAKTAFEFWQSFVYELGTQRRTGT